MKLALTRRRKIALGSVLLLILVWLLWPDRSLARVRSLRSELADKALAPDQRDAKAKQLREAMQKLTPDQRNALFADGRKRATEEMERYHQLSPAEKRKYLDQQITRQQEITQRIQQGQANGQQRPPGFGGPGGPGSQNRPQTADDRERRRQQRLDDSSPRERELRDQFRRDMEQRRRERGLPPNNPTRGR